MEIVIKRAYEQASDEDGYRVLVDRLWPRGVSKARAALDEWCKDVAPSPELRVWFGHRPERFEEFAARHDLRLVFPNLEMANYWNTPFVFTCFMYRK